MHASTRGAVIALLAATAACSNEATIADNTCGNFVLDPGEDCDRPPLAGVTVCTATCRIVCDPTMRGTVCDPTKPIDGVCCPDGFTCGVDKTCHAPSGHLQSVELAQPFDMTSYAVADLNNDLLSDVLGVSSGLVQARYGSTTSPLSFSVQLNAPFATGAAAIGDYKNSGHPGVLIPTAAGVFAFDTDGGVPLPVSFPAEPVQSHTTRLRAAPNPLAVSNLAGVSSLVRLDFNETTGAAQLSGNDGTTPLSAMPVSPCNQTFTGVELLHGRALHPFKDCPTGLGACRVRVPIVADTGAATQAPLQVCVDGFYGARATTFIPAATTQSFGFSATDGEALFAHLAGPSSTACPDLVVPIVAPFGNTALETTLVIPGTGVAGACDVDATKIFVAKLVVNATAQPIGIPLAAVTLDVSPSPVTAIVTSSGIFTINTTTQTVQQMTAATRSWRFAAVADLDNDGLDDIVTTGTTEDLEVLEQLKLTPAPALPMWRDTRIATSAVVNQVALGDYDGSGFADIAMTTIDGTNDNTGTISVAFAQPPAGFAAPVPLAVVPEFAYIVATDILDPSLPLGLDQTGDLVIGYGGNPKFPSVNARSRLVNLYGSADRNMTAPWLTPTNIAQTKIATVNTDCTAGGSKASGCLAGFALAIGHFDTGNPQATPPTVPTFDTLAIFSNTPDATAAVAIGMARSANGDTFTTTTTRPGVPVASCAGGCPAQGPTFVPPAGKYAAWTRTTGGDILLAVRADRPFMPTECGAFYIPTNVTAADPVGLVGLPCSALVAAGVAAAEFIGVGEFRQVTASDTAPVFSISRVDATGVQSVKLWTVSLQSVAGNMVPVLASPIDLAAEVSSFVGATATGAITCVDAISANLGTRTSGATTFGGAGNDLVVACHVPHIDKRNAMVTTLQLFGRFADPTGASASFYEELADENKDLFVNMSVGDFNGDGIDDLVFTTGTQGQGQVHLRLQCDTHDPLCKTGGP